MGEHGMIERARRCQFQDRGAQGLGVGAIFRWKQFQAASWQVNDSVAKHHQRAFLEKVSRLTWATPSQWESTPPGDWKRIRIEGCALCLLQTGTRRHQNRDPKLLHRRIAHPGMVSTRQTNRGGVEREIGPEKFENRGERVEHECISCCRDGGAREVNAVFWGKDIPANNTVKRSENLDDRFQWFLRRSRMIRTPITAAVASRRMPLY